MASLTSFPRPGYPASLTSPTTPPRAPAAPTKLGTLGRLPDALLRDQLLPQLRQAGDLFAFGHTCRHAKFLAHEALAAELQRQVRALVRDAHGAGPISRPPASAALATAKADLRLLERAQPRDDLGAARRLLARPDRDGAAALAHLDALPAELAQTSAVGGLRATALRALHRHHEADAVISATAARDPQFWPAYLQAQRAADYELNPADVALVLSQPTPDPDSLATLALDACRKDDCLLAEGAARSALRRNPTQLRANAALARVAGNERRFAEMLTYIDREVDLLRGSHAPEQALTALFDCIGAVEGQLGRDKTRALVASLRAADAVPALARVAAKTRIFVLVRQGQLEAAATESLIYGIKVQHHGQEHNLAAEIYPYMNLLRRRLYTFTLRTKAKLNRLPAPAPSTRWLPTHVAPATPNGTLTALLATSVLADNVLPRLDATSLMCFAHASTQTRRAVVQSAATMVFRSSSALLRGAHRAAYVPHPGAEAAGQEARAGLQLLARLQPAALSDRVLGLLRQDLPEAALQLICDRVAEGTQDADLFALQTLVLRRLGRFYEAEVAERHAAQFAEATMRRLLQQSLRGRWRASSTDLLQAALDRPHDARTFVALAEEGAVLVASEHAERFARRALQLDSACLGANGVLAGYYAQQGLHTEALAYTIRETELQLRRWAPRSQLPSSWLNLSDQALPEAVTASMLHYLQGLIERKQALQQVLNIRLRILAANDRLEEAAEECLRHGLRAAPMDARGSAARTYLDQMGYARRQRFKLARAFLPIGR